VLEIGFDRSVKTIVHWHLPVSEAVNTPGYKDNSDHLP
jgi:hypothetical protein